MPLKKNLTSSEEACKRDELARALGATSIELRYEPRVDSNTGKLVGVEGVMWKSFPGQGCVASEVAEHCSDAIIAELWLWKLTQILSLFSEVKNFTSQLTVDSPDLVFSLNLLHQQLKTEEWAIELLDFLKSAHIPGSCIEIEITAHGESLDTAVAKFSFDEVRSRGVILTLDSFPCDEQSFFEWARFRFDKVKTSKLMVPSINESPYVWARKRVILSNLVSMATGLDTEVVVDGIELSLQYEFLKSLPTREWQGAYWSPPQSFEEFSSRLKEMLSIGQKIKSV